MSLSQLLKMEFESANEKLISWRRYLHQHPELSFEEYDTATYINDELSKLTHVEIYRPTKTSIVGRLKGKKGPGKTVALRADIDALPIEEKTYLSFSSNRQGVMHACGHDGHASILLGTAMVLNNIVEHITGEYVFLFQHAEEVPPGGAQEMVKKGVLKGVDYVLGLHLWSTTPLGEIHITEGPISSASDIFDIVVEGKSGHASQPESAIDAIAVGAQIVTNLQHIVSRSISPLESGVISVTRFHSGDAYNVIADKAYIGGSVRSLTQEVREEIKDAMESICTSIANAHQATATLHYEYGYDPVINEKELTKKLRANAGRVFADEKEIQIKQVPPALGGEDFSAFSNLVPGCYATIGAKVEGKEAFPHHHPQFDINEKALRIALQYYISSALHINGHY